jgi:hypothetical protein
MLEAILCGTAFCCLAGMVNILKEGDKDKLNFDEIFYQTNLCNLKNEYPYLEKYAKEKYCSRYRFKLPGGLSIEDFYIRKSAIENFVQKDSVVVRKVPNSNMIDILIMNSISNLAYNRDYCKQFGQLVPLGIDLEKGEEVLFDIFADANTNLMLVGMPGCGKSTLLNVVLAHLINVFAAEDVEFAINDTKMTDLFLFKKCKHTKRYCTGTGNAIDFLKKEIEEVNMRYELATKYNFRNIRDMKKAGYSIPFRVVVVEEIVSYKGNDEFHRLLGELTSKCRAAGVTVIITTQDNLHETLPSKNFFNSIIGMKVLDEIRSNLVMEDADLYKLNNTNTEKFFKLKDIAHDRVYCQSFGIEDEDIITIINK